MNADTNSDGSGASETSAATGVSPSRVVLIVLVTILVTLGGSYWFLKTYVFAREFKPVELNAKEERVLDAKLRALGFQPAADKQHYDPTTPSP
ncbi:MAG: hypothetical protein PVJ83_08020, partial [Gammaproteobacteria bacterium]